jgi:hypothetical protein
MSYYCIDAIIQRAIKLGLIRLDHPLASQLGREYVATLKEIDKLLDRILHGLTIRRMMYEYAEICRVPLDQQLNLENLNQHPLAFNKSQKTGLSNLAKASLSLDTQAGSINNPNIIVNCDTGTEGELGCKPGYIKVYQAVYSASYGANNYKDIYVHNVHGKDQIVIQPATGGKCNVSIGNPFRILGWYMNYMNQGSKAPLIRMWEIPEKYYIEVLLRFCGTEKQIKDKNNKGQYFVEMCDHKATNQFGIWTHTEDPTIVSYDTEGKKIKGGLVPTKAGKEFLSNSCNLITYYDPNGKHTPNKRDGECRDIKLLLTHLGIPTRLNDRFHDFGMSLSDAEGNLTMNDEAAQRDRDLLNIIEMIRYPDLRGIKQVSMLDKEQIRIFVNLITYNNLNPQKFNKSSKYTKTGLNIRNLRYETDFMRLVYQSTSWHIILKNVATKLRDSICENVNLQKEVKESLSKICSTCETDYDVLNWIIENSSHQCLNNLTIDAFNIILRPLCSRRNNRISTKGQKFKVGMLSDLSFEIGKSHRTELSELEGRPDSLDGYSRAGFVSGVMFSEPLSPNIKTSNTTVQLNLHKQLVSRLLDQGIPMMGGISGTTRDIFATIYNFVPQPPLFWPMFNVVAAFMIKHHYHSLVECFIAASQFYPHEVFTSCNAESFYKIIADKSEVKFYP